jgi:hypothetical protein
MIRPTVANGAARAIKDSLAGEPAGADRTKVIREAR